MPDPTPADVAAYTQGRLGETDPRTPLLLAGALAAARAYCGWHVTGEKSVDLVIDGPGAPLLVLPTLRLVALTALSEDGVHLDVDTIEWSGRGLLFKPGRACWTKKLRGITASITHGFEDAPDFKAAVLSAVDRVLTGGPEVIGPFQYPTGTPAIAGTAFSGAEKGILDLYRLEPRP